MKKINKMIIDLGQYKKKDTSVYTGRPFGEDVREKLKLEKLDLTDEKVFFEFPEETTSISSSFYLGLLFPSIKKLGFIKFEEKYKFKFKTENLNLKNVLESNLEIGKMYAELSMDKNFDFLKLG